MRPSVRSRGALLSLALPLVLGVAPLPAQQAPPCVGCADADALIRRFDLREARVAMRDVPGWAPPRRIVVSLGEAMAAPVRAALPGVEVIAVRGTADALAVIGEADAWVGQCSTALIRAATNLRWIQMPSAGVGSCAREPLVRERGIVVTNAQALYGPQVAEHALAMMLSFARRLYAYQAQQRAGGWSHGTADVDAIMDGPIWELEGKVLLVVGLGGLGTEVARRAHALGMRVRATRNSRREGPDFVEYVGLAHEAAGLAASADVVVNTTPLTDETRGMFDLAFFRAMKPSAYFINVGRGGSVVTDDLVTALRDGSIAGAGLDVTAPEPLPPGHPLWSMPNVILTPHTGGGSDIAFERFRVLLAENARRYARGDRLLSVVDLERGY